MEGAYVLTLGLVALYFAPAILASVRGHPNALPIWILDFFLGWTLLGWIGSLIWACTAIPEKSHA